MLQIFLLERRDEPFTLRSRRLGRLGEGRFTGRSSEVKTPSPPLRRQHGPIPSKPAHRCAGPHREGLRCGTSGCHREQGDCSTPNRQASPGGQGGGQPLLSSPCSCLHVAGQTRAARFSNLSGKPEIRLVWAVPKFQTRGAKAGTSEGQI